MFRNSGGGHKRSSFLPFVILRTLLSVIMLGIFSVAIYQAYRTFSGIDPLKLDPKSTLTTIVASEEVVKLLNGLFGVDIASKIPQLGDKVIPAPGNSDSSSKKSNRTDVILRFAIVTDSHNDNQNLIKALQQAKAQNSKFVIGLGDYSQVGTISELQETKKVFSASGLPYYSTAGDHDLWDCRNRNLVPSCSYSQTFGLTYQSFEDEGVRFILLYNSDNYIGIDSVQRDWLEDILDKIQQEKPKLTLAFLSIPLYHPSSDHFMGKSNPKLTTQAGEITKLLKDGGVKAVFAGDTHAYSNYTDPKTDLPMVTIGAVTSERNTQAARFALVDVYSDGSYNVADTVIK